MTVGEWTKSGHLGTFNTDVLHARFVTHRFARHAHSEFVVAYVEAGVEAHYFRGQTIHVPAQRVVVVNPEEPHMGGSSSAEGFTYRVLYPPVALLQRIATELAGQRSPAAVYFREPAVTRR